MYGAADKAIRAINRKNIRLFDKLRVLKFDELNIIRTVRNVYGQSTAYAEKQYLEMAIFVYEYAFSLANGKRKRKRRLDRDWLLDYLEEYDPVTLYRFLPETDRKKERLIEAIVASPHKQTEIDKGLRYWTVQLAQYAINITDRAAMTAFRDAGVKYVKWNTEKDNKVCDTCRDLDGEVFPINDAPSKQHFNCRCYYTPVAKT